jgi:putative salt-induced outer membrane protein
MSKFSAVILCMSVLTPTVASYADDAPAPPPPPEGVWTGKGQAGYLSSQGNTDAKSANAALDMALTDGLWKHELHLGGLYGENTGIVSAERFDAKWQSDYSITQDLFAFGGLRYSHDLFSGFDYQETATTGVGYKFLDTDSIKLSAQVGAGYRRELPELLIKNSVGEVVQRIKQPEESGAIATAGIDYSQALSSTTTVTDKLLVETGSQNTLLTNALALSVKMTTKLALSLGYGLQDNTNPPAGLKKVDTIETVNLVYSF